MNDPTYLASIYRMHAVSFWEAARTLADSEEPNGVMGLPFQFLIAHAAELLLKAALLKRGQTESQLRSYAYRHDLEALISAVRDKGVPITDSTLRLVQAIGPQHKRHALRYTALVDDGEPTHMIRPAAAFEMLDELLMLTRIATHGV